MSSSVRRANLTLFHALFYGVIVLALILGVALLVIPGQVFGLFPPSVTKIPPTPDLSYYGAVIGRTRLVGAGLIGVMVAALAFRKRLASFFDALRVSFQAEGRRTTAGLQSWLRTESRPHLILFAAILIVGMVLRLLALTRTLNNDETRAYLDFGAQPWLTIVGNYSAPANHILQSLLTHVSTRLFGAEIAAIRLPDLLAGCALVPAIYLAGRRLYNKQAGLLAMALTACAGYLIDYATDARGYSMTTLFAVGMLVAASVLATRPSLAIWAFYSLCGALGAWTVPTMLYPAAGIALWLLGELMLQPNRRARLIEFFRGHLALGLITAAFYTPVLVFSGINSLVANTTVSPGTLSALSSTLPRFLGSMWTVANLWGMALTVGFALCAVIGLAAQSRLSRFRISASLVIFIAGLTIVIVQRRLPFERVWLHMLPAYYLLVGAGVSFLIARLVKRLVLSHALVTGIAALTLVGALNDRLNTPPSPDLFPEAATIAEWLKAELRPGDQVQARYPTRSVTLYYFMRLGGDPAWFAEQGEENPDSGARYLILIDQDRSPLSANLKLNYDDGTPIKPVLRYQTGNARVYEVWKGH